jgi:thiamine kinase-like enzyme
MLGDSSVEVMGFEVISEPFEFPRFGEKSFHDFVCDYQSSSGPGKVSVILRVMPEMDAVMMLTGDTEHRELKAFAMGLFDQVPSTFKVPYLHVIDKPGQYWAFLEDVRPAMHALGMHAKCPDETVRQILAHLAAFHGKFWEKREIIDLPWLMSLRRPVDYFYRTINDVQDGMKNAADSSVYVTERWPWLAEGVVNMMNALPPDTRKVIEKLYREPEGLLREVEAMPQTLCHYDFDNRNLGIDGDRTVVIDWEILGRGISGSDVVRFMVYQQPENLDVLLDFYLDELERRVGHKIDRAEWRRGYELAAIAEWQIRGVLFGVMVNAPSAPIPDDQREPMKERVFGDIGYVESLVRKCGLA